MNRKARQLMTAARQPEPLLAILGLTGVALALVSASRGSTAEIWDAWREIAGGMVAGAVVGAVLHWLAEQAEARRDEHNTELATTARRHALAVAVILAEDLAGRQLAGQDLIGITLSGRDLRLADLKFADLSNAVLQSADLSNADLGGAKLVDVIGDQLDLSSADLEDADLRRGNLGDASFRNANLRFADLTNAWLAGADLTGVDLTNAALSGAVLTGADFTGANLTNLDIHEGAYWDVANPPSWPADFEEPRNRQANN